MTTPPCKRPRAQEENAIDIIPKIDGCMSVLASRQERVA